MGVYKSRLEYIESKRQDALKIAYGTYKNIDIFEKELYESNIEQKHLFFDSYLHVYVERTWQEMLSSHISLLDTYHTEGFVNVADLYPDLDYTNPAYSGATEWGWHFMDIDSPTIRIEYPVIRDEESGLDTILISYITAPKFYPWDQPLE